jgi:dihydrofolate reductase / thymidylate synthase
MTEPKLDLIVACDQNRGIGKNGQLPWHLAGDLKHFAKTTSAKAPGEPDNVVIMGRKTWQSIPAQFRPLKNRCNIVLTHDAGAHTDLDLDKERAKKVLFEESLDAALDQVFNKLHPGKCFVIGGASIYSKAIEHSACHLLYLTEIEAIFDCDLFFPPFLDRFALLSQSDQQVENGIKYSFRVYERQRR